MDESGVDVASVMAGVGRDDRATILLHAGDGDKLLEKLTRTGKSLLKMRF